jgi:protein SCO1/2
MTPSHRVPERIPYWLVLLAGLLTTPAWGAVNGDQQAILDEVRFEQRVGNQLPGDATFVDADGQSQRLAALTGDKPSVYVLAWFSCPNLCPMVLDQVARATAKLPFDADEYRIVVASIAPDEGPAAAREIRARLKRRHPGDFANWHFLTGERPAIETLAQRVGFHYVYDAERERYAHPAGMIITTPEGTVSQYLFGLDPKPTDLRLALTEAGQGGVGAVTDRLLLRCYRFNPSTGQYTVAVMQLVQWVGSTFIFGVGGMLFWLWRRERH